MLIQAFKKYIYLFIGSLLITSHMNAFAQLAITASDGRFMPTFCAVSLCREFYAIHFVSGHQQHTVPAGQPTEIAFEVADAFGKPDTSATLGLTKTSQEIMTHKLSTTQAKVNEQAQASVRVSALDKAG